MSLAKVRKNKLIQYPYGFAELQAENPFSDFGSNRDVAALFAKTEAAESGDQVVEVQSGERPDHNPATQYLIETGPEIAGDVWVTTWTVLQRPPPSGSEISERARTALAASDRTLLRCLEANTPVPAEWADYRQALRAVVSDPKQPFPERPDYP